MRSDRRIGLAVLLLLVTAASVQARQESTDPARDGRPEPQWLIASPFEPTWPATDPVSRWLAPGDAVAPSEVARGIAGFGLVDPGGGFLVHPVDGPSLAPWLDVLTEPTASSAPDLRQGARDTRLPERFDRLNALLAPDRGRQPPLSPALLMHSVPEPATLLCLIGALAWATHRPVRSTRRARSGPAQLTGSG